MQQQFLQQLESAPRPPTPHEPHEVLHNLLMRDDVEHSTQEQFHRQQSQSNAMAAAGGVSSPIEPAAKRFKIPPEESSVISRFIIEKAIDMNWPEQPLKVAGDIAPLVFAAFPTTVKVADPSTINRHIKGAIKGFLTSLGPGGVMRVEIVDQSTTGNEAEGADAQELKRYCQQLAEMKAKENVVAKLAEDEKAKVRKAAAEVQEAEAGYMDRSLKDPRWQETSDVEVFSSSDEDTGEGPNKNKKAKKKRTKTQKRQGGARARAVNAHANDVLGQEQELQGMDLETPSSFDNGDMEFIKSLQKLSQDSSQAQATAISTAISTAIAGNSAADTVQQTQQLSQTPGPAAFNAAMAELRTAVRNGDITPTEALVWKNRVRAEHSLPPMDK